MADDTSAEHPAPADRWAWLHTLLAVPKVGDFLATCLALAPLVATLFVLEGLGVNTDSDSGLGWLLLVGLLPTFLWLRVMERGAGVRLLLPIPVINIPIMWSLPALALASLAMIFG